jgi:class 3 adenylate cyclase
MDVSTAGCYINLGAVRTAQGRHREATPLINEGLRISLANGHKEYIRNGYEKLAEADSARGDMAAAFAHTKLARVYNDSIFNESITGQLAEMETRFETVQKEQEIVVLNKDNEIKQQQIRRQTLLRNGFIGGFAVMLLFSVIFFVQRNRIGKERDRSEELLLNILPYETAQELKAKGSSEARLIDQVTVLFTDFKGFTQMSETLSPQELVRDLNECFSAFDRICEKHGIEKIKTIGDAYMAAGGLPIPTDTHAVDVVRAALEMRNFIEEGKARKIEEGRPYFEIRIGIHTGPVVAGIVGIKKFQYDIWGDTVNTASRMESSGQVGQVNISGPTYELVKDTFACEFRGEVEAKGKGKLKMYFVG